MALGELYSRHRAVINLALGAALGFVVGLVAGFGLAQIRPGGDLLVQTAVMEEVNGIGEFEIYYPRPYASPPALRIILDESLWDYTKVTEQTEKGFRFSTGSPTPRGGRSPATKPRAWRRNEDLIVLCRTATPS